MFFVLCLILSLVCSFVAGMAFLYHIEFKSQGAKTVFITFLVSGLVALALTISVHFWL